MGFGGRPLAEGGHGPVRFTLNAETRKCLGKLRGKGEIASQLVERVLVAPCKALDDEPQPGCEDIRDIKKMVDDKLASAIQARNYKMIQVLSNIEEGIQTYVNLCEYKPSTPGPDNFQASRPVMTFTYFRPEIKRSEQP